MMKHLKRQHGFTIIELMIATTIFSLVLMISLGAIMTITRMYYQGTLQAKTQNRVREIVDEIADDIRYLPGEVVVTEDPSVISGAIETGDDGSVGSVDPEAPVDYFGEHCIGEIRYRYLLGFKTVTNATLASSDQDARDANGTLVREPSANCDAADLNDTDRTTLAESIVTDDSLTSMLDENMRLLEFAINRSSSIDSNRYTVAVTVAYGDDDLIDFVDGNFICKPDNIARAYCAVSRLEVDVTKRLETSGT